MREFKAALSENVVTMVRRNNAKHLSHSTRDRRRFL